MNEGDDDDNNDDDDFMISVERCVFLNFSIIATIPGPSTSLIPLSQCSAPTACFRRSHHSLSIILLFFSHQHILIV